jgi:predicted RNA-binding protein
MCQATVYRETRNDREEILRDVVSMERTDEGWWVTPLLETPRKVQGEITRIDFLKHTVTLTQEETA